MWPAIHPLEDRIQRTEPVNVRAIAMAIRDYVALQAPAEILLPLIA
jgi:hypothetical protein